MDEKAAVLGNKQETEKLSMYTILNLLYDTINKLQIVKQDSEALVSDLCLGNLNHISPLPNKGKKENMDDDNLVTEFYSKIQDINIAIELIQKDILYSNSIIK